MEHVAAYWLGDEDAVVTLAFSSDGVRFGAPVDVGRDDAGAELRSGTTFGAVQVADGAVAVRVTTDMPLTGFALVGILAGGEADGPPAPVLLPAALGAEAPAVISRAGWGANPGYLDWAPQFHPGKKVIVHHTEDNASSAGTPGYYAGLVRSIYYYHAVTQGWGDIAYLPIDPLGNVYEGPIPTTIRHSCREDLHRNGVIGGHTYNHNAAPWASRSSARTQAGDITPRQLGLAGAAHRLGGTEAASTCREDPYSKP